MTAGQLPTFREMCRNAYRMLGDVEDELRSDWQAGSEPTTQQAAALRKARSHIAHAKMALTESEGWPRTPVTS
ncbi:MAG: hypothetical protein ACRDRO_23460 [Pseudonocardiaceae bacterium]